MSASRFKPQLPLPEQTTRLDVIPRAPASIPQRTDDTTAGARAAVGSRDAGGRAGRLRGHPADDQPMRGVVRRCILGVSGVHLSARPASTR